MPIVAVPEYLAKEDLSMASPGLRFGMYLPLWGRNNRSGLVDWTTKDTNYRITGKNRIEREFKDDNKRGALNQAMRLHGPDIACLRALRERQAATVAGLAQTGFLTLDAKSVAPFTTGLGHEHPLENGFAFLNPYGLPYLPASGIKGVIRQAARELAGESSGEKWSLDSKWNQQAIDCLFGKEDCSDAQRGALQFWDVLPEIKGDSLLVEVMTAHQSHYLQNNESPHESGQPNPINFVAVPPDSHFSFHVMCDLPFLRSVAKELAEDDLWQTLVFEAFSHAFEWLGFGAKTAVGYGAMMRDEQAAAERAAQQKQQAFEQLSPEQQLLETLRISYEKEKVAGHLQGGCRTAELRTKILREAKEWEAAMRQSAADLIDLVTADLPWSKKAKKQGAPTQVEELRK